MSRRPREDQRTEPGFRPELQAQSAAAQLSIASVPQPLPAHVPRVIWDTDRIGELTRVLYQLKGSRSAEAVCWAAMRLDSLVAGIGLTEDDSRFIARLEEAVLTQRTVGATIAERENERAHESACAAFRRAPSHYAGTR